MDTPLNLYPRQTPFGYVEIGGKRYPVNIEDKWHRLIEQMIQRMGGASVYSVSDIAGLLPTDGNIIVGDGAAWVAESGSTARASLGLAIGTNVQAWDADLDAIAALAHTSGNTIAANGSAWTAIKNNPGASAAPTTGDDSDDGYSIGSRWFDTTADKEYVALDVTVGAAVWKETTASGGGGSLVLLEQHTASTSASLDFTTAISATYDEYQIEVLNLIPATNNVDLWMRMDVGSGFDSGNNYFLGGENFNSSGQNVQGQASGAKTSAIKFQNAANISNTAAYGVCGTIRLFSPGSANNKMVMFHLGYLAGTVLHNLVGTGAYANTSAVTGFQFLQSSGNISSGTIRVYGIAKS